MSIVQGIGKLNDLLTSNEIDKLEKIADRHKEESKISFTIQSVEGKSIAVTTVQGETPSGKYASEAALIKKTEDLFRKPLSGYKILVSTESYRPSPAALVDAIWIEKKMLVKGIRIKQIAFETGIDRESISDWVTGKRSMSQIVKAMFYFYLSR